LQRSAQMPYVFIYEGVYNDVWRAVVNVLGDIYSITAANRDAGLIKTDEINYYFNDELYEHPRKDRVEDEVKYKLKLRLAKAFITETREPAVRVSVLKEFYKYKNYYTKWERVPTDGFEEQIILYRIKQKMRIARAKKRIKKGAED